MTNVKMFNSLIVAAAVSFSTVCLSLALGHAFVAGELGHGFVSGEYRARAASPALTRHSTAAYVLFGAFAAVNISCAFVVTRSYSRRPRLLLFAGMLSLLSLASAVLTYYLVFCERSAPIRAVLNKMDPF